MKVINWLSLLMKNNKLFVPECPIKISKEPHVIEIEDVDNALPFSRLTYNRFLGLG